MTIAQRWRKLEHIERMAILKCIRSLDTSQISDFVSEPFNLIPTHIQKQIKKCMKDFGL